jgi:ParB family chromosome partitioning protein
MADDGPAPARDERGLAALRRLLAIAETDTGQSRRVADFLLAWWNARACGGFDPTDLWGVEASIRDDMLAVLQLIARERGFPTAYGLGDAFVALVRRWRPGLEQAHR